MNKRQQIHPLMSVALLIALALVLLMPLSIERAQGNPPALIVRPDGEIATGDACPMPATSAVYKNIQAAIDCAVQGDTIHVYPGTYNESALNRPEFGTGDGALSFGLYVGTDDLQIVGVDADGTPIENSGAVLAIVNAQATSNGVQGALISGANVTISGLRINPITPANDKTLEILGDNFTLRHSHITSSGGSALYFRDARFVGDATSGTATLKRYTISENIIDGGSIVLTNGAGFGAPSNGQIIRANVIRDTLNWAVSLSGSTTLSASLVYPIGVPLITDNVFENNAFGVLRALGIYEMTDAQINAFIFDNGNTFNQGWVVAYQSDGVSLRTTLSLGYDTRREVGTVIDNQASRVVDNAGDIVRVGPGTYFNQTVTLNRNRVTLQGSGIDRTVIQGTTCSSTGITLASSHRNLTVRDLTVTGHLDGILIGQNNLVSITDTLLEDVRVVGNCRHGISSLANRTTRLTVNRADVSDNGTASNPSGTNGRGLWLNGGIKDGVTITDSTFSGNQFGGIEIGAGNVTNLRIENNTVSDNPEYGITVNGAKGAGANGVLANIVSGARYGIEMRNATGNGASSGAGSVLISGNTVNGAALATTTDSGGIIVNRRAVDSNFVADQPSGVVVSDNSVRGYVNTGSGDGFGIVIEGSAHWIVNNAVTANDVGLMLQAGSRINETGTDYFDKGNAASTRQTRVRANTLSANRDGLVSLGDVRGTVNNNNLIYSNTRDGVRILDEASTGLSVNNNQICINAALGVRNRGTTTINARNNWWGSPDGPGPVGPGSGDEVSARVDFSGFMTTSPAESPCQPNTPTPTATQTFTPTPITPSPTATQTATPTPITPSPTATDTPAPLGALRLEKIVAWGNAAPVDGTTFKLCINGPSHPNWSCQIVRYPDALVAFWDKLTAGTYSISEENPGEVWSVSYSTTQVNIVGGQTARESVTNSNTTPPICQVQPGPKSDLTGYIKLIDGVAYGYITNKTQTACVYPIGLAAYYAYNDRVDDQYIFGADVRGAERIEAGQTVTLTLPLPGTCYVQVDLFYGHLISPMFNGQRYGSRLFAALHPNKSTPCLNLPDSDGDGLRDPIDPDNGTFNDKDGDGIGDGYDTVFNDIDGDGIADAFDDDRDGDGYSNREELLAGSSPNDPSSVPPPPPTAEPTPEPVETVEPPGDGGGEIDPLPPHDELEQ